MVEMIYEHYKTKKNLSSKKLFAKFTKNSKIADKTKFVRTVSSDIKKLKKS